MIYKDKNGNTKYYYYKKKRGRKKKRGPKKIIKKIGRKKQQTWNYKIISCTFNKQDSVVGYFHTMNETEIAKQKLLLENDSICIEKKTFIPFNNNKHKKIIDFKCEYLVLEKIRDNSDNVTQLRNEYGKIVDTISTNDKWKIIDKFQHKIEETYWVYGCNPRTDKKNFLWILDEFINKYLICDNNLIIRVYYYYNKIIFRYDDNDINFVICKNESDSIRLYNKLIENCNKYKHVIFIGKVINKSETGQFIINLISDKTGWQKNKIIRKNTL